MGEWLKASRSKHDLPIGDVSWSIQIEEHVEGKLYMVCFEEHEQIKKNVKRTICTEQMLEKDHLEKLRDDINFMLGETS